MYIIAYNFRLAVQSWLKFLLIVTMLSLSGLRLEKGDLNKKILFNCRYSVFPRLECDPD
jgi:hypothetical protein